MKKRVKMPRRKDKRKFAKYVERTHVKNVMPHPMRGGIRL